MQEFIFDLVKSAKQQSFLVLFMTVLIVCLGWFAKDMVNLVIESNSSTTKALEKNTQVNEWMIKTLERVETNNESSFGSLEKNQEKIIEKLNIIYETSK